MSQRTPAGENEESPGLFLEQLQGVKHLAMGVMNILVWVRYPHWFTMPVKKFVYLVFIWLRCPFRKLYVGYVNYVPANIRFVSYTLVT